MKILIRVKEEPVEFFIKNRDKINEAVEKSLEEVAISVASAAKEGVAVDTGRLRASIRPSGRGLLWEVGSKVQYAEAVEYGTKPHYPPYEAIHDWVRRKRGGLGVSVKDISRVAYSIQEKIGRVGTKPKPFLSKAVDLVSPKINDILKYWYDKIVGKM